MPAQPFYKRFRAWRRLARENRRFSLGATSKDVWALAEALDEAAATAKHAVRALRLIERAHGDDCTCDECLANPHDKTDCQATARAVLRWIETQRD